MSRTSKSENNAGRPESVSRTVVLTPTEPPVCAVTGARYEFETLSEVETGFGLAVVRVRSVVFRAWLGGSGYGLARRFEVAVRTPRSIRERQAPSDGGFVTVTPAWLPEGGVVPANHAEVHVAVGVSIEAAASRRLARAAGDRSPQRRQRAARPEMPASGGMGERSVPAVPPGPAPLPPRRYKSAAHRLHAVLGACGVPDHYAEAAAILGREVPSFSALSPSEMALVEDSVTARRAA